MRFTDPVGGIERGDNVGDDAGVGSTGRQRRPSVGPIGRLLWRIDNRRPTPIDGDHDTPPMHIFLEKLCSDDPRPVRRRRDRRRPAHELVAPRPSVCKPPKPFSAIRAAEPSPITRRELSARRDQTVVTRVDEGRGQSRPGSDDVEAAHIAEIDRRWSRMTLLDPPTPTIDHFPVLPHREELLARERAEAARLAPRADRSPPNHRLRGGPDRRAGSGNLAGGARDRPTLAGSEEDNPETKRCADLRQSRGTREMADEDIRNEVRPQPRPAASPGGGYTTSAKLLADEILEVGSSVCCGKHERSGVLAVNGERQLDAERLQNDLHAPVAETAASEDVLQKARLNSERGGCLRDRKTPAIDLGRDDLDKPQKRRLHKKKNSRAGRCTQRCTTNTTTRYRPQPLLAAKRR